MREWFRGFLVGTSIVILTACGDGGTTLGGDAPGNTPPTIDTAFENIELQENSGTTNYELNVSDSDGDNLTISVESNDTSIITVTPNWTNPLASGSYDGQTLTFSLTTVADAFGLVKITVMVNDGESSTTRSFDVNVTEQITYSWVTGEWGRCSGPCGVDNGEQRRTVICQASTGEHADAWMCSGAKPATTQACTASLCPVNHAPTIDTAFEDIALQENSGTTNYELNVSDSDGDSLTISVESNDTSIITVTPNWTNPLLWADYNGETLDFNLTTVADAFGPVRITIRVYDGDTSATRSFDVNVTAVVSAAVKKTGQTISYDRNGAEVTDGSLKDDGFYQKGVDHNYTRANDIVTDHVTGLMWQDDANVSSVTKQWLTDANYNTCASDTSSPACYDTSGDTAATYCADLSLGGYDDWRLPTAEELEGIVDYGKVDPAIDTAYFDNASSSYYWSSTTFEHDKHRAWIVHFYAGYVDSHRKGYNYYVRCVRGGQ